LAQAAGVLRREVAVAATASVICLALFATVPVELGRILGALWVLSLVTVNAVFIGSVAVWFGRRYKLPVFRAAVAVALLFSLWNDNHLVRLLSAIGPRPSLKL